MNESTRHLIGEAELNMMKKTMSMMAAENAVAAMEGRPPANLLNPEAVSPREA